MPHKTKLLLILVAIVAVTLACATLSGEKSTPTPEPPPPTNPPSPTETATSDPVPTEETIPPVDGNVLFQDNFSDSNSGWDQYDDADGITDYVDGAYKISVYTDTYFYWANPYRTFQDVIIEVDTQMITNEDDNQYGIVCRHVDVDNWYVLVISGDGYAAIRKRLQAGELEYVADWVQSEAINTGMASNKLRAECVGNRLSLFANGTLVVEAFDSDFASGDVGLLAGTFSATQTEIIFDNFIVTSP